MVSFFFFFLSRQFLIFFLQSFLLLLRFLFLGHHFQNLLQCAVLLYLFIKASSVWSFSLRDSSSFSSDSGFCCLSAWADPSTGCSPPARSRWTFSKPLNRPDPPASSFFSPFLSWAVQSACRGYLSKMLQPCWVCQLSLYINASWGTLLNFLPTDPWGAGGLLALCVWPPFNGNIQQQAFQRFFKLINV